MELFTKIRLRIGRFILSRKVARTKREVSYSTFKNIKNIGIVWDASKPVEFACLNRFHQKMLESKIDVTVMGYFPGKSLPDQYTAIRYLTCIRKDELNNFDYQNVIIIGGQAEDHAESLVNVEFIKQLETKYAIPYEANAPIYFGSGFKVDIRELWNRIRIYI